jgi:hypothetical protein
MLDERRERRKARRRAGRSTFRMLRHEAWRKARSAWPRLLTFLVAWGLLAFVLAWMQRTDFMRGFFVGLMVGLLGFFLMVFLVAVGVAQRQMGGTAEQWTAEILEQLDRASWFIAHDVSFDTMNVDHVLVGPRRIYAVETKWTSWHGNPQFLQGARRSAVRGARRLQSLLASEGLKREVTPLVVVWGPGTEAMRAEPLWEDTAGLVAGRHADTWLEKLSASGRDLARDLPAERAIAGFIAARDAYQDAH